MKEGIGFLRLKIVADEGFDLREFYDRILDGELGDLIAEDDVEAVRGGSALFAGGDERLPEVTIKLKRPHSEAELAELQAQLLAMLGNRAHIHIDA